LFIKNEKKVSKDRGLGLLNFFFENEEDFSEDQVNEIGIIVEEKGLVEDKGLCRDVSS